MKSDGTTGSSQTVWDFFRILIPTSMFALGWFVSAQLFARYVGYNPAIVRNPQVILGKHVYSVMVYLAACIKHVSDTNLQPHVFRSIVPMAAFTLTGLLFVAVWGVVRTVSSRDKNTHGTARWGTKKDLIENGLFAEEP